MQVESIEALHLLSAVCCPLLFCIYFCFCLFITCCRRHPRLMLVRQTTQLRAIMTIIRSNANTFTITEKQRNMHKTIETVFHCCTIFRVAFTVSSWSVCILCLCFNMKLISIHYFVLHIHIVVSAALC